MNIVRSGSSSYYCAALDDLEQMLAGHYYTRSDGHSQYERSRWRNGRSLLVIYHNGTVLLQGADTTTPRQLFESLNEQPALPF